MVANGPLLNIKGSVELTVTFDRIEVTYISLRGNKAIFCTDRLRHSPQKLNRHINKCKLPAFSECSDNYSHAQKSQNSKNHPNCELHYRAIFGKFIRMGDQKARCLTNERGLMHSRTRSSNRRQTRSFNCA